MNFIKQHARHCIGVLIISISGLVLVSCGGGGGGGDGNSSTMQITPPPLPTAVAEITPEVAPANGRVSGTITSGPGIIYDIGTFDTGQRGELVDNSVDVTVSARVYHQDGREIATQPFSDGRRGRMFIAPSLGLYYVHITANEAAARSANGLQPLSSHIRGRYVCVFTRFMDSTDNSPLRLAWPNDPYPDLEVRNSGVRDGGTNGEFIRAIEVAAGDRFTMQLLVVNLGPVRSPSVTLSYTQSPDSTISRSDTVQPGDTTTVPGLPTVVIDGNGDIINFFYRGTITFTAPTSTSYPQTYYYGGCVTRHFSESNRNNNCSPAATVTVVAPDTTSTAPPIQPGVPVDGVITVPQQEDRYQIQAYNGDTIIIYTTSPGGSNVLSGPCGRLFDSVGVLLRIDGTVDQNFRIEYTVTITGIYFIEVSACFVSTGRYRLVVERHRPDLVVESPSVDDANPRHLGSITLSTTVRNIGQGNAISHRRTYYISTDATITPDDTAFDGGFFVYPLLSAGESIRDRQRLGMPLANGTYYLGMCVSEVVREVDTMNNCSYGVAVVISSLTVPALPSSGIVHGEIAEQREEDPYFFHASIGDNIVAYTTSPGGSSVGVLPDPSGRLFDDFGEVLRSNEDGGVGTNFRIEHTATYTGTYFIEVSGRISFHTGRYRLVVDRN